MGAGRQRNPGCEGAFISSLEGTIKRCRRYAAEESDDGSTGNVLNELANFLNLQGVFIAHLALDPDTSAELIPASVHAGERIPAWMDLRVFGNDPAPFRTFVIGCAQMLTEQRVVLERIVEEQIENPGPIEAILAEHPVPAGEDWESAEELMGSTANAFRANFQVCLMVARDYDEWIEEMLEAGYGDELEEGFEGEAFDEE